MKPPGLDDIDAITRGFVDAILRAADPARAVRDAWAPALDSADRVVLLAAGKASAPMTEAALDRVAPRVVSGAVTCVPEHESRLADLIAKHAIPVRVFPADHPLPTERNLEAADAIAQTASAAGPDDTVLALISGGASAHLTSPSAGFTIDDLRAVTDALLRAGATINELNAVRKHLERLKGGGLARLIHPARADVLVLSDVLGDPLDTIGSGPTAPDPSTHAEALDALGTHDLTGAHPAVAAHLDRGVLGQIPETPKPGDPIFEHFSHTVIANNQAAIDAAAAEAESIGLRIHRVQPGVQGEAAEVGRTLVAELKTLARPACVILGGETTVTVGQAPGHGGRNQELALAAAIDLDPVPDAAVLAFATDGVDGPTDAAGSIVTPTTAGQLANAGIDPRASLADHDSHTALGRIGALIRTGPTGTNINDITVGMVF